MNGIQDIIKFKIMNGFVLEDNDNIIISTDGKIKNEKFEMWGHLRNNKLKQQRNK